MIAIIDYGSGNIAAVANIYKQLKIPYIVTDIPDELHKADRYILPGVGAFDVTMRHLNDSGMTLVLNDQIIRKEKKSWVSAWGCKSWQSQAKKANYLVWGGFRAGYEKLMKPFG